MTDPKSQTSNSSGCPVASKDISVDSATAKTTGWGSWLGWSKKKEASEDVSKGSDSSSNASACPVAKPASIEEAAGYSQDPHPDQQGVVLSTHRMISSIPRGSLQEGEKAPHHQPPTTSEDNSKGCKSTSADASQNNNWMYPSEQQFFNALRRKGWDRVQAKDVPNVLEIHNTVNERTWNQVLEWEAPMDLDSVVRQQQQTSLKLVRFQGRPNDLSPQAFLWTKILRWNEPPFDRHDWYVQKQSAGVSESSQAYPIQRYVIDYYMIPPPYPEMPPTPYVDARPALDSPRAFFMRFQRLIQEELPGLTFQYNVWKCRQRQYYDGSVPSTESTTAKSGQS